MSLELDAALVRLLMLTDDDHQRVCLAVAGSGAPLPEDAQLAGLAAELRRLRWLEPEATSMALLLDAAARHPEAVEQHLAWLAASGPAPVWIELTDAALIPQRAVALAC